MKKEKSIGKKQIFTALAILCGIGSVIVFWLNDPSELISILLILLCGVFAYLGLRHKSIYIVFAMGIAHCLPTLTLVEDSSEDLIGELYIDAFAMGCLFAVLGMIGIIAGFLFHYGFAGKAAPAVSGKAKRVAAIAGAVLFFAVPLELMTMLVGDPIVYWQNRARADEFVKTKYPDGSYEFYDSVYGENGAGVYSYCYRKKGVSMQPLYIIDCTVDTQLPVVKYFSSCSIKDSFGDNDYMFYFD